MLDEVADVDVLDERGCTALQFASPPRGGQGGLIDGGDGAADGAREPGRPHRLRAVNPSQSKPSADPSFEAYSVYLGTMTGGAVPRVFRGQEPPAPAGVVALQYTGMPKQSMQTVFSYGVWQARQSAWTRGRPELVLTVRSLSSQWAEAVAHLAEAMRTRCQFAYGDVIGSQRPLAGDTDMDAWLVFAPAVVPREAARVEIGADLPVNLQGLYPIHRAEGDLVREQGLDALWTLEWDPYDVGRPSAV